MADITGMPDPAFAITGLRSVDLELADLDGAVDFYTRVWGLTLAERQADSAWLRATGPDCHVLALHRAPTSRMRSMTFRAADTTDLDALLARSITAGATRDTGVAGWNEHGGGNGFSLRDRAGRTIRVVQGDAPAAPLSFDPDRPERLAHVNFNSDDTMRDVAWFVDGLGFVITDRSKMMGFVRTNSDHHSIVIADASVNTLNHIAFNLPGWEGVMKASGRMIDAGRTIGWGPGRHGPGDNVFVYFVDPHGFVIEQTAEVLQVDDRYRVGGPEDWTWPPGRTDQWGLCPPKTAECKAAQLAIPFA